MALGEIRFHRMKEMYAGEGFMEKMLGWFYFRLPALFCAYHSRMPFLNGFVAIFASSKSLTMSDIGEIRGLTGFPWSHWGDFFDF